MKNALQPLSVYHDDAFSQSPPNGAKEYRVITRVKNNLLLSAIEKAGFRTLTEFANKANISLHKLCDIVSFRQAPLDKNGDWRPIIHSVCEVLNKMPCELFTERQMYLSGATAKTVEVSEAEAVWALENTSTADPHEKLEAGEIHNVLCSALDTLSQREKEVLMLYYGLDGAALSIHEIAEELGITRTRVMQIRDRGLRKLQHPGRLRHIKEVAGEIGNRPQQPEQEA